MCLPWYKWLNNEQWMTHTTHSTAHHSHHTTKCYTMQIYPVQTTHLTRYFNGGAAISIWMRFRIFVFLVFIAIEKNSFPNTVAFSENKFAAKSRNFFKYFIAKTSMVDKVHVRFVALYVIWTDKCDKCEQSGAISYQIVPKSICVRLVATATVTAS